ncbi:MAG: hypothetical protein IT356_00505 [Gemmatimonadaceae bacterium]|nr:hypothetical protein [Gemmatimonadaceae bacterium]
MTAANRRACFAVVTPGFEGVTEHELLALGFSDAAAEAGGVSFSASDAELVRANLWLRAASRVLVRMATFTAKSFAELERHAKRVRWAGYASGNSSIALRVTCRKSRLYHSGAVAERLAKWIAAAMPGVEVVRTEADDCVAQLFVVRFERDVCTISADSSGELLHRRGYRLATAKAPMRETLAAGVLLALGYDGSCPLIDPMCGSGTFAIEAALIARNIAPGIRRAFACESWPGFDDRAAARERAGARVAARAARAAIIASDRDAGAVEAALANARRAGVAADVAISRRPLSAIETVPGPGLLVANPPYGERVGDRNALRNLYAQFGNVARTRLPGWRVALVSADRALDAQVQLPFETVAAFSNGGIKVRLVATPAP